MKLALTFVVALLMAFPLFSQTPSNDAFNCSTMVDLGIAPACPGTIFTNVNATPDIVATNDVVSCFSSGTAQRDVWFKFVCSDTLFDYRITLRAAGVNPIENPEFAVYRGDCLFDGLGEIACVSAAVGKDSISVDLFGLTPNETYYIRVSDWSATAAANSGQFTLCVDKIPPILTINQGGSSLCMGTLYDTGGADDDYSANENFTFVICPDQPSECISFTLEYYHLEPSAPQIPGQADQLSFFDGPNVNSPLLAALDGNGGSQENIAGGGGVCFQIHATSGCLTVRFKSDATVQEEGWKGTWTCSSDACPVEDIIQIDTSVASADLEGAVSTGGAMVTVTSINCPQGGLGTFEYPTDNNTLNMEKGLLLTSGQALNAIGPNSSPSTGSQNEPFGFEDLGDPDLEYLSTTFGNGAPSFDVCIVELDVFAATNEVVFEYVFGSDEYPEFIFDQLGYNDIFAFLVSGPGIVGDPNLSNSALNIAVLPNTATLVQIDSVNNQVNWQYYRNNEISQTIEYDGLTSDFMGVKKSLTARVPVTPCNTYHLKLAIADRGDESYDSGVFVSEIKAGSPAIEIAFSSGVDYFIENCTGSNDTLFLTLNKAPTVATSFNIAVGGTALQGVDYLLNIPSAITFQPGQQTLAFAIVPIADNIAEGTETITITLSHDYGCGEVVLKTLTVDILDNVLVEVKGGDTLTVCTGDFLQLNATGASTYVWSPANLVSNAFIANPFTSPSQSVWLELIGVVGTCFDKDSVFVRVIAPTIDASYLTSNIICLGGTVQLQAVSSEPVITWSPADGLDDPNSATPIATPTFSTTYTASVTLEGCTVDDAVSIIVDKLVLPVVIDDLVQCQNFPVKLASDVTSTNTYTWAPAAGLSDSTISGPIALPDTSTLYILTVTSENGVCTWTDSVLVTITPADINILGEDSLKLCLGSPAFELKAIVNPSGGSIVTWTPSDFLSSSTGLSVMADPKETVTITVAYSVNGCPPVLDSVYIRVDSLPDLSIYAMPDKPFYCPGDTIYLLSNLFVPGNATSGFPGIVHAWEPAGTQLWDLDDWQMLVIATDSIMYRRTTTIGACMGTDSVFIPVPRVEIMFTDPDPICPGQSAQISLTVTPANTTLEWDELNAATLSCDDCPNPIATPTTTTTYHVTTPDAECPTGADITVVVKPLPILSLQNKVSCALGPIQLNTFVEQGVTYEWSPAQFLDDPLKGDPTATPTLPGEYVYTVVATKDGCTGPPANVTLFAYDASIVVTTPPQNVCAGTPITLTATTTGTPGTIGWLPAGPTVTPTVQTTYTATLFYGMSCTQQDDVTIDVIPIPNLNLVDTSVCLGNPVRLNALNEAGVTYVWTPTNGLSVPNNVGNPTATPLVTTIYSVVATSTVNNCVAKDTATVNIASAEVNAGVNQTICFGEMATLTATVTGTQGGAFTWSNSQTSSSITVSPTAEQLFTVLYAYGPANTCSDIDDVRVFVGDELKLSQITGPTDSVCAGVKVGLKVDIIKGEGTLAWFIDGVVIPGQTMDTITVTPQGEAVEYSVVLTDDVTGCTATTDPIKVAVKRCFQIPNAFTPNGDAANDTFGPLFFGGTAEVLSFVIYNRWGQKVFEATPERKAWDGKDDSKDASSDVYIYSIRVRFGNGDEETKHGEVTLIR